jgi:hypothetical protein
MENGQAVQATPEVKVEAQKPVVTEDIITKVSKFKKEEPKVESPVSDKFDYKDIEKIKDPEAKAWAEKAYKSMQAGFTPKLMEASELKKKVEELETKFGNSQNWSAERVQSLLNDPNFVNAAQSVLQSQQSQPAMTEEQWSSLSDTDKAKFVEMEKKLSVLEQQNQFEVKKHQDSTLATKYANYNPQVVDRTVQDLLSGRIQATREEIWKVVDYENAVQRAYEMGMQEGSSKGNEKINAMSFTSNGVNPEQRNTIEPDKDGKIDAEFFRKLYSYHSGRIAQQRK